VARTPATTRCRPRHGVAARTYELSELLVDVLGMEDVGATYPHRVTTTRPATRCAAQVGDRPLRLLRVRDLELVELPDADQCCGFGGTFASRTRHLAAMLADKLAAVTATGATS
jgi:L-lactate dehydrogenase complex protein LldE